MKTTILKIIIVLTIVFIMISNCYNSYTAENEISKEQIENALEKFESSSQNKDNYKIQMEDENIIITTSDNEKYELKYEIEQKEISFMLELPVKNGMSYNDYKKQTNNLMLPMIGFMTVAKINEIEFIDSLAYFSLIHLNSEWNGDFSSDKSYTIIDENGNELVSGGAKRLETSEFPNRVLEYVDSIYREKESIDDSNDINSFNWSIEKEERNDSYKLISKLTINLESDFSRLKNYAETSDYENIVKTTENNYNITNNINNNENLTNVNTETNIDNTIKNENLPAVGNKKFAGVVVGIAIIILIVAIIRKNSYKE